jgi:hypothetical protein
MAMFWKLSTLILLLCATVVSASLVYMDTGQLVEESILIITGEVDRVESFRGADGFIYSRAYVLVNDFILGDSETDIVEVVYPGGVVGGVGMTTSISPTFEEGMQVLLFLKVNDEGEFVLTNHAASKFTLKNGIVVEKGTPLSDFIKEITAALDL